MCRVLACTVRLLAAAAGLATDATATEFAIWDTDAREGVSQPAPEEAEEVSKVPWEGKAGASNGTAEEPEHSLSGPPLVAAPDTPEWSLEGNCYKTGCGLVDERDCCGGACCSEFEGFYSEAAAPRAQVPRGYPPGPGCKVFDLASQHMIVPTGVSSVALSSGARQRVACADGYASQDGNHSYYLSCAYRPQGASLQATTNLRCVPTSAPADGPGSWPPWVDHDRPDSVDKCEPFDLASRHMFGGIDIPGCETVMLLAAAKIGKVGVDGCKRTIQSLEVHVGDRLQKVVCAPGYEPQGTDAWLTCTQAGLPASTDLNCVAAAVPATRTGADTAIPDRSGETGETTGALASDAMSSAFALGGWACVLCLLGATVVFRRQKRAADAAGSGAGQPRKKRAGQRRDGGSSGPSLEMNEMACQTVELEDARDTGTRDARVQPELKAGYDATKANPYTSTACSASIAGAAGDARTATNDMGTSLLSWAPLEGDGRFGDGAPSTQQDHQAQDVFLARLPWETDEELLTDSSSESALSTLSYYSPDEMGFDLAVATDSASESGASAPSYYSPDEMELGHAMPAVNANEQVWVDASQTPRHQQQQHRQHPTVAPLENGRRQQPVPTEWCADPNSTQATQLAVDRHIGVDAEMASGPATAESLVRDILSSAPSEAGIARRPRVSRPKVQTVLTCPVEGCGFRTRADSRMLRHQRTHTGERPFLCKHPVRQGGRVAYRHSFVPCARPPLLAQSV